ncbi:MAG: DUF3037 domain-containing protein [Prochlorotrichaceae cyanobacterium]|jgi:hypothetical protein
MASRYSVIQYVPNPIADERINIGVIAFDENGVKVQFLSQWDRVRSFGSSSDLTTIKDFAHRMKAAAAEGLLFPGDESNHIPQHERLAKVSKGWINSIQFTEPRGSLETLDGLLEDIAETYLMESAQKKVTLRDRQIAARVTTSGIRKALEHRYDADKAKNLLKSKYLLKGRRQNHTFDVTVANGHAILSAHGISFEVQTPEDLRESLAWKIADFKEEQPKFPLAVVALPPVVTTPDHDKLSDLYQQTVKTYKSLGAEVVTEEKIEAWASSHLPG